MTDTMNDPGATVATGNEEATEAWSGVLFDRFLEHRDIVVEGLAQFGTEAMRMHPPARGERVLDIGCGFGDATQSLAALIGEEAEAVGVDVSEPFIDHAREEATGGGVPNVRFLAGDVQVMDLEGPYDYVFSRMGVMFFANPVAALRNMHSAMNPGGRFVAAVWRRKLDNGWLHEAEKVVEQYLEEPEETDEPTCGPGPFSMANADTISEQLQIAGFERVSLDRCDRPMKIGDDLDHAVRFAMAIGPAGEVIRLAADDAEKIRPKLEAEIREALSQFTQPDGKVVAPASTWILSARAAA
jgi:SAM-dependent methyltransferase